MDKFFKSEISHIRIQFGIKIWTYLLFSKIFVSVKNVIIVVIIAIFKIHKITDLLTGWWNSLAHIIFHTICLVMSVWELRWINWWFLFWSIKPFLQRSVAEAVIWRLNIIIFPTWLWRPQVGNKFLYFFNALRIHFFKTWGNFFAFFSLFQLFPHHILILFKL